MRWAACYIVLNEEDYLEYSLKSIYDFADKIIIMHGACEGYRGANDKGLSIDKTADIINDFPDPEDKMIICEYGWAKDKNELRNAYLTCVQNMEDEIDWILVMDGDELYRTNTLRRIDYAARTNKDLVLIMNGQWWFWGDLKHICEMDKDKMYEQKSNFPKYYDKNDDFMIDGEYHERIFKNIPGLNYNKSHSTVSDSDGRFLYSDPYYKNNRLFTNNKWFRRFHYGCLKTYDDHVARKLYYGKRDDPNFEDTKEYSHKSRYFDWLQEGDSALDKPNLHFYVKEFSDYHPKEIYKHPWSNKKNFEYGNFPFKCYGEK